MIDRALRKARELVTRLREELREAREQLERADLWLYTLPDDPEGFAFWVESSSVVASLRRKLARAREDLRGHRVRAVLRRREPPPPPRPALPMVQLGLFDRPQRKSARRRRREQLPGPTGAPPAGEDLHEQLQEPAGAPAAGEDLHEQPPEPTGAPPAGEDLHEQLPEPTGAPPAGEDLEHVHLSESDLVDLQELPASWCEECQRTKPGTEWNDRRGMRLCPGCWPAESLRVGVAA